MQPPSNGSGQKQACYHDDAEIEADGEERTGKCVEDVRVQNNIDFDGWWIAQESFIERVEVGGGLDAEK